mgnify:CR=1 FL=1
MQTQASVGQGKVGGAGSEQGKVGGAGDGQGKGCGAGSEQERDSGDGDKAVGEENGGEEQKCDEQFMALLKGLKKGSKLTVKGYEIKEGETSPPKRYNSGRLIGSDIAVRYQRQSLLPTGRQCGVQQWAYGQVYHIVDHLSHQRGGDHLSLFIQRQIFDIHQLFRVLGLLGRFMPGSSSK